jgi:hypothetical protein
MSPIRMTPEIAAGLSLAEQHEWYRAQTSRRTVSRRSLLGAGAAIAGSTLLGSAPASASPFPAQVTAPDWATGSAVKPFGRHIGFGADPCTQMLVSWQTSSAVKKPFIRLGLLPGVFGQRIDAEVRPLVSELSWMHPIDSLPLIAPTTVTQYYLHARLEHLLPGVTYYYVVGHDGHDPAGDPSLGGVYSFRTAPLPVARRPFTFTAFGDEGVSYDSVANGNLIAGLNPAFHLHAGDICYAEDNGHGLITDNYDARVWDSFFVQNEHVAARTPWMIALGNHDMEAWYSPDGYGGEEARFTFPGNGPRQCPGTYAWRYGNVGLISLDANDVSYAIPANLDYSGGAQTKWLDEKLREFRGTPGLDFIVVYFHHSTYSTCSSDGAEGGAQDLWTPIFDRYQVDLVINGHNHVYERNDPIRGGVAVAVAPIGATIDPVRQGTTYLVAGGGGNSVYTFPAEDTYLGHETPNDQPVAMLVNQRGGGQKAVDVTWSRVRYRGYGLIAAEVTPAQPGRPTTISVRALAQDGTVIDRFTLVRRAK